MNHSSQKNIYLWSMHSSNSNNQLVQTATHASFRGNEMSSWVMATVGQLVLYDTQESSPTM